MPQLSEFQLAVDNLLANEGGYKPAGDPADPGGETHWGFSKRSYPTLDIANLTKDEAIALYKSDFWDKYQLGAITDTHIASNVLDLMVNFGPSGGAVVIQRALNGVGVPTTVDGDFGLQSLANCNKPDALDLLAELRAQAALRYCRIVVRKPDEEEAIFERNLLGWLRRAVRP